MQMPTCPPAGRRDVRRSFLAHGRSQGWGNRMLLRRFWAAGLACCLILLGRPAGGVVADGPRETPRPRPGVIWATCNNKLTTEVKKADQKPQVGFWWAAHSHIGRVSAASLPPPADGALAPPASAAAACPCMPLLPSAPCGTRLACLPLCSSHIHPAQLWWYWRCLCCCAVWLPAAVLWRLDL